MRLIRPALALVSLIVAGCGDAPVTSDGKSADLVWIATAGNAATTLWPQVSEVAPCRPRLAFAAGRFVVTHCDAGSSSVIVSSVDAATGAHVDLLSPARNFFVI